MNTMRLLLAKDFRYSKWWIVATSLSQTIGIAATLSIQNPEKQGLAVFMVSAFHLIFAFLLSAKITHCDKVLGDVSFLASRPVSRSRLMSSKLLSLATFVVIPDVLLHLAGFSLFFVAPHRTDLMLLAIERMLMISLLASCALVAANFTKTVGTMAWVAGGAVAIYIYLFFLLSWVEDDSLIGHHLEVSRLVLRDVCCVGSVLISSYVLACSRRLLSAIAASIIFLAAGSWALRSLNWNFVHSLAERAKNEEALVAGQSLEWSGPPIISWRYSQRFFHLNQSGRITGLKPSWHGEFLQSKGVAIDSNGKRHQGLKLIERWEGETNNLPGKFAQDMAEQVRAGSRMPYHEEWPFFECEVNEGASPLAQS